MLKRFFRSTYKSKNSISKEKAAELEEELRQLNEENDLRKSQIDKFLLLIVSDKANEKKYHARIKVNSEEIIKNNIRIEIIENTLLDK